MVSSFYDLFMEKEAAISSAKATVGAILVLLLAETLLFLSPEGFDGGVVPSAARGHVFHSPWKDVAAPKEEGALFLLGDPLQQMQPWRVHMRRTWEQGGLPYWNHLNGLGQPFLANPQTRCLYPLNWVFLVGEEMTWQLPFLAWHVFLFGLGMILWLRRFAVGFLGMSVASVSTACFGMQVLWLLSPHATTFAWLPWMLLALEGYWAGPNRRCLWLAALATAMLLLAGHPETAFKSVVCVWIYALGRIPGLRRQGKPVFGNLAKFAGAQFLGLLLALPQVLPFLDYLKESQSLAMRQAEAAYPPLGSLGEFASELMTWLSQVASIEAHGNDLAEANWWLDSINLREIGLVYGGVIAAVLGLLGFLRAHPLRLPLLLVAAFAAIVTFRLPYLYDLLCYLPGFDVGANQRFASLLMLSLATSAALALDGLILDPLAIAKRKTWLTIFVTLAVLVSALVYEGRVQGPTNDFQVQLFTNAMIVSVVLAFLLVGALLLLGRSWGQKLGVLLILGLLLGDVGIHSRPRIPWADPQETWPMTPIVEFMVENLPPEDGRIICVGASFPGDMNLPHNLAFLDSYSAMQPALESAFLEAAKTPVTPSGKMRIAWTLLNQFSIPLLNMASVRYLFIPGDWSDKNDHTEGVIVDARGDRFRQLYADRDGMILERLDAQPRAALRHRRVPGSTLAELTASPFDPQMYVMTDEQGVLAGFGGQASTVSYTANKVVVEADVLGGPQWLVMSDLFSPLWRASVDGEEAKIFPVNGIFRGVRLDEGSHRIVLETSPPKPLKWGVGGAVLAICLLLGLTLRPRRNIS